MKSKTVIYTWPQSQECAECAHGEFLLFKNNSSYLCGASFEKKPKRGNCPLYVEKVTDEQNNIE